MDTRISQRRAAWNSFAVGSKPGTRVAGGCYQIQNVNLLHARYDRFIKPFCGPATKNLDGYIRWLEVPR
jgi:hypothetical protein